jgi:RNA polymerase sigma-70 factor (sigma-E family)
VAGVTIDPQLADLCRREHPRLVGLLALYVGDRATAEELAQETLVRLHQHWPRVGRMAKPTSWLSMVGINLARSWWRRRFAEQRAHRRLGDPPEATSATEADDVLVVRAAVAQLPHRQRTALVLRYYAGLTVAEAAEQMRCPEGTVKSLTHRALAALRTQLDPAGDLAGSHPHPPIPPVPAANPEVTPHV